MIRFAFLASFLSLVQLATAGPPRPPEPIQLGELWVGSTSFGLGTAFNYGSSTKYITFTTPSLGQPLLRREGDEKYLEGSGEFRPSMTRSGYFESRYVVFDWPDTNSQPRQLEYGNIFINPPLTDSNGNGLPDITDGPAGFSGVGAGIIVPQWVARGEQRFTRDNYTFNFTRNPGAPTGTYSVDLIEGAAAFGGIYRTWDRSGSIRYQRSDTLGYFDFFLPVGDGSAFTRYRRIDSMEVQLNSFVFGRTESQPAFSGSSMRLHRTGGDVYRGMFTARDGNAETRWGDYRSFFVEIRDRSGAMNDSDNDGVSDLAEPLKPYIALQPVSKIVPTGGTATFKVGALGTGLNYQWRYQGTDIPSATLRSYTLRGVTKGNVGSYDVRVSNDGGAVFSNPVSLTLKL